LVKASTFKAVISATTAHEAKTFYLYTLCKGKLHNHAFKITQAQPTLGNYVLS